MPARCLLFAVVLLLPGNSSLADVVEDRLLTFYADYCNDCHSGPDAEGDVDFSNLPGWESEVWSRVQSLVAGELMPPEDGNPPDAAERETFLTDLRVARVRAACNAPQPTRATTLRRLNRTEYGNTVRDLLGIDLDIQDDLPSDDVGEGFDNIGEVLSVSPLLIEKYLDAAERAAAATILVVEPNQPQKASSEKMELEGPVTTQLGDAAGLLSQGAARTQMDVPLPGAYALTVEVSADQAGDELAQMRVRCNQRVIQQVAVVAKRPDTEVHSFAIEFRERGSVELAVEFMNDFYRSQEQLDRNLYVHAMRLVGPAAVSHEDYPVHHRRLIRKRPGPQTSVAVAARGCLEPLLYRAFRRPVDEQQLRRHVTMVRQAVEDGESFEQGMRRALQTVLVSPYFLFRLELAPELDDAELDDYALASRLSYFLWSTLPDETLLKRARQGRLRHPDELRRQVKRMVRDDRIWALAEDFASQWLNLDLLDDVTPDPNKFPDFDPEMRSTMRMETLSLFHEMLRRDLSVMTMLNADFSFMNESLARLYGIAGVQGPAFRRVSLAGLPRAGVLTHPSILLLSSTPGGTSPVKRGKWIMENVLGTPPPPPPPNVPELAPADEQAGERPTLRQQLEIHRADPQCAACHRQMDALGFGLENFDVLGRWRTRDGNRPIDASGALFGNKAFQGPVQLLELLAGRRDQFSRTLTRKMLTYALGRGLDWQDECAVEDILLKMSQRDDRVSVLLEEIVVTPQFRRSGFDSAEVKKVAKP